MTRKILSTLLLLLAGCAPAAGPAETPGVVTPLELEPPPIYALLGYRRELSLTSEQIAALDAIAERVRERNAPLVDSLESVGDRGGRGFIAIDERTEPILERIRESHREAMEEVGEVLTDEQEGTTCRLFDQARDPESDRRRPRSPGGAAADSAARGLGARVWAWCGGS